MEISLLLLNKILELFIMIFMGYLLVKTGILKEKESRSLSMITLYLVMPCVIIKSFQVEFTTEKMKGLAIAFLAAIVIHIIFAVMIQFFGKIYVLNEVEKASIMYSNAGNLIVPIVTSILGGDWILYSSAYVSVQLILLWTHGKFILNGETKFNIKKIFTNINMISIIVGILLFITKIKLPVPVIAAMGSVSTMIAPISMFVAGMLIANMNLKKIFGNKRIYFITFLRMIISPIIILILIKFSGIYTWIKSGNTILLITFLATITPSASTITQMSQIYGKDAEYASAINVITTIICIISMPLMVYLYELVI